MAWSNSLVLCLFVRCVFVEGFRSVHQHSVGQCCNMTEEEVGFTVSGFAQLSFILFVLCLVLL